MMEKNRRNSHIGKKIALAAAIQSVLAPLTMAQGGAPEEVVVSAQKREQLPTEVPFSVEVFGAEELARASITNAKELFQFSPSIEYWGVRARYSFF
ncbi:MAG: hypothetical protein ACR2PS_01480 [Pseudomonadales bacterium]